MRGKPTDKGFIYFMRRADGVGAIKIGCSQIPRHRLAEHQHWSPELLEIVAFVPGTFADEKRLHRQFDEHRLHGEWFEAVPPILAAMSRAASLGELPPPQPNDRIVQIMARYEAGETLQAIANNFGVTRQRIEQIVRREGGKPRGPRGMRRAPVWRKLEEVRSLAAAGCSAAEIADAVGDNKQNIFNACRAEGIKIRRAKKQVSQRIAQMAFDVAADYKAGIRTGEIAQKYGIDQPNIYRFLRLAGVKPNRVVPSVNCLPMADVIAAYHAGETLRELAARYDRTPRTIRDNLARAGVQLRTRAENEAIRIARLRAANKRRAA